jgi:hypothetical protein
MPVDEPGDVSLRGCGLHQFKPDFSYPVARHPDLFPFVLIGLIGSAFSRKRLPLPARLIEILYGNADVVHPVDFHDLPLSALHNRDASKRWVALRRNPSGKS